MLVDPFTWICGSLGWLRKHPRGRLTRDWVKINNVPQILAIPLDIVVVISVFVQFHISRVCVNAATCIFLQLIVIWGAWQLLSNVSFTLWSFVCLLVCKLRFIKQLLLSFHEAFFAMGRSRDHERYTVLGFHGDLWCVQESFLSLSVVSLKRVSSA